MRLMFLLVLWAGAEEWPGICLQPVESLLMSMRTNPRFHTGVIHDAKRRAQLVSAPASAAWLRVACIFRRRT
jgi:hypothetical protein